jgi:hypothetical protein
MNRIVWLTTTLLVGLGGFSSSARANPSADSIKPLPAMADVVMVERQNAATLTQVAEQIDHQLNAEDESLPTIADLIPDDLFDGLVDENGEVNLPLGITVYDAMGTTSVGFGTQF